MMIPRTTRARTPATIRISVAVSMFLSFSALAGNPAFGPPGKIDLLDQPQLMTRRDEARYQLPRRSRGGLARREEPGEACAGERLPAKSATYRAKDIRPQEQRPG